MAIPQANGTTLIKNGRVVDPSQGIDREDDVLIVDGKIAAIRRTSQKADVTIDATGLIVCPGLIDAHVHLREPGGEDHETIETGTRAAAAGGFTAVCCMPNTRPPIADPETVRQVLDRVAEVAACRVYPVATMTAGQKGDTPADFAALTEAGAVAFSDDGIGVDDPAVMRAVMQAAREHGALLVQHCEVAEIAGGGCVNMGKISDTLGVPGIDPRAEEEMLARDLDALRETPCRYHVAHISTAKAVSLVRRAKAEGLTVTAEVTPHHLTLTEDAVLTAGTDAKMNPPLRTEEDAEACREGLADGTIDCIVTDHAPHTAEAKAKQLADAPFGIVGLETAVGVCWTALVSTGRLTVPQFVMAMSTKPSQIFALFRKGSLLSANNGDFSLIDPDQTWTCDVNSFHSKSKNSPYHGWNLTARPVITLVNGTVTHAAPDARITRRK